MRAGCRVVLTRATEDNARLRAALGDIAADVVDYPCIAIEGVPVDAKTIELLKKSHYSAVGFVSRNAVEHFFATVRDAAPSEVVAIGPSTAEAVLHHGWPVTAVPDVASAAGTIEQLDSMFRSSGPILYVRGDMGEDAIPDALRQRGKQVDVVVVYRTKGVDLAPLDEGAHPTLVTFASPSAVRHFVGRNKDRRGAALAIGETTAQVAREEGFEVTVAPSPTIQGMAAAIQRWVAAHA